MRIIKVISQCLIEERKEEQAKDISWFVDLDQSNDNAHMHTNGLRKYRRLPEKAIAKFKASKIFNFDF